MSAQKKSHGKSKAKAAPAKIEYSGKICLRNYWLKIGLSKAELGALGQIAKLFESKKHQTTGNAARMVLTAALMHWDKLYPLVITAQKYAAAEGFTLKEDFDSDTIAQKFNLPWKGNRNPVV